MSIRSNPLKLCLINITPGIQFSWNQNQRLQPFSFLMASVTYTKVKDSIKHVRRILINNYISRILVQSEIQLKFSSHPIFSDMFSRHQSDFSLIGLNVLPSAIMQGKFDSVLWDMSMFFLICQWHVYYARTPIFTHNTSF